MRCFKALLVLGVVFSFIPASYAQSRRNSDTRRSSDFRRDRSTSNNKYADLGVLLGLHVNDYSTNPNVNFNSSLSPVVGVYGEIPIIEHLFGLVQLSYAAYDGDYNIVAAGQTFKVRVDNDYLDLLLGARAKPLDLEYVNPFIDAGLNVGFKLASNVKVTQNGTAVQTTGSSSAINSTNFALMIGAGGEITVLPIPVIFGVRYLHGLSDITKTTGEKWTTRAFQVYAGATVFTF